MDGAEPRNASRQGQLLGGQGRVRIPGVWVVEAGEVARRFVGGVVVHGTYPLLPPYARSSLVWGDDDRVSGRSRPGGACRGGDAAAFAELVTPCQRMLFTVCLRICGNDADALDATQDALVAAGRHLDRFDGRSRFSTWLYRIAHNAALMQIRRRREHPGLADELPDHQMVDPTRARG